MRICCFGGNAKAAVLSLLMGRLIFILQPGGKTRVAHGGVAICNFKLLNRTAVLLMAQTTGRKTDPTVRKG